MKKLLILLCLLLSVPMFADEYSDYKNKLMLEAQQEVYKIREKADYNKAMLAEEQKKLEAYREYEKLYQEYETYCDRHIIEYMLSISNRISFEEFITIVKHLDYDTVMSWRSTK